MYFKKTEESIRWFLDASEYTGFHKKMAEVIAPFLNKDDSLCDVGCGFGRLDLALSSYVAEITAIDVEPQVVDVLQSDCRNKGIENIHTICSDIDKQLSTHDVFLMSFFGHGGQMEKCIPYCRKKLIRVVNAENTSTLYPNRHRKIKKATIAEVESSLKTLNLPYQVIEVSLEFGQPLRSKEDAREFFTFNAPEATDQEIHEFLEENGQSTGRSDFPIYIPNRKDIGIFVIKTEV